MDRGAWKTFAVLTWILIGICALLCLYSWRQGVAIREAHERAERRKADRTGGMDTNTVQLTPEDHEPHWSGPYYLRQGFRVSRATGVESKHWEGGEAYHKGAVCPVCKIPLLLLWDLDCADIRAHTSPKVLGSLERLPLYYCWRCCADNLSYQVIGPREIRVIGNEGSPQGDDFPYKDYPRSFPRRPIRLDPIPYEVERLLIIAQDVGVEWLSKADRVLASAWMGEELKSYSTPWRHQLGGLPYLIQGRERIRCPNLDCENHAKFDTWSDSPMKILAVIHNDPQSGLPMVDPIEQKERINYWVQVVFHICAKCLTISASNQCD